MFKQPAPRPEPSHWTEAALQALARASVVGARVPLAGLSSEPQHHGRPEPREAIDKQEDTMAVAYVREFDVGADRSTTNYDAISGRMRLAEDPAEGLIVHAAGFTGGKFRMIEIWESRAHEERFERERLRPAVREVVGDGGAAPTTESYELHNLVARG